MGDCAGLVPGPAELHRHGIALLERRRQIGRRDHYRDCPLGVDKRVAAAVEDLTTGGRDVERTDVVDLSLPGVGVAREDLEEPQAEEDDREHRQREAAEDRYTEGELGGEGRAPVVGWLVHREILGGGASRKSSGSRFTEGSAGWGQAVASG